MVNAIAPSYILTDMNKTAYEDEQTNKLITFKTPMARWQQADEMVGLTVYLASDASSYVTGASIALDGRIAGKVTGQGSSWITLNS